MRTVPWRFPHVVDSALGLKLGQMDATENGAPAANDLHASLRSTLFAGVGSSPRVSQDGELKSATPILIDDSRLGVVLQHPELLLHLKQEVVRVNGGETLIKLGN